jgi:hypothetical protein
VLSALACGELIRGYNLASGMDLDRLNINNKVDISTILQISTVSIWAVFYLRQINQLTGHPKPTF